MKYISKKGAASLLLAVLFLVPIASEAQLGSSVVYDPMNYQNALLRYGQLQQHLLELQKTVAKVTSQLNLALQMAQYVHNMPARYRAVFSQWRSFTSGDLYGNTSRWVSAVNGAGPQSISPAYQQAIVPFLAYNQMALSAINPRRCAASQVSRGFLAVDGRCKHIRSDDGRKHPGKRANRPTANRESRTGFAFS